MKPSKFGTLALLAVPLGTWACSHEEKPAASGYEAEMTPAARSTPSAPGTVGAETAPQLSDPQITTVLRAANVAEIDQARTAVGKVKNAEVKKFTEMMIAEHGQAVKNIDELDTQLGFQPADSQLSTELGVRSTQVENQLSATNDATFDRLYMIDQIDAHRRLLDAIDTRLIPGARRDEVKDLLQATRPVVEKHLQLSQKILDSLR